MWFYWNVSDSNNYKKAFNRDIGHIYRYVNYQNADETLTKMLTYYCGWLARTLGVARQRSENHLRGSPNAASPITRGRVHLAASLRVSQWLVQTNRALRARKSR